MGSASREALVSARGVLDSLGSELSATSGEQLLSVARTLQANAALRSALGNPVAESAIKNAVVQRVFGSVVDSATLTLLTTVADSRWSAAADIVDALEDLGIRAFAKTAPASLALDEELLTVNAAVSSNAELELALGSALGIADAKASLARTLLTGKASDATLAIVTHLVTVPRGRRIGELLNGAARTVADEQGYAIATVTAAQSVDAQRLTRLEKSLAVSYDRPVKINLVIDPTIIGGLHIQIGDDVIDGSVSARLSELRRQLAS
ncbi:F0F1 ATP synthase subunit delta [Klugiella xanthotipulae]|uniref:ATP synthase subunit delta n=1 Tax=Klugiella xanthotipulae TaxID=244735 RepID=A0A543HY18_9MICO|nr:F0F1 ATP synthase subunit delta [Klugiella xanthotipulae]TQM63232.1 ATP synthase F1 subcomplex delta subunit [Klugiella xanthotipulae]